MPLSNSVVQLEAMLKPHIELVYKDFELSDKSGEKFYPESSFCLNQRLDAPAQSGFSIKKIAVS
jgi:hypothetical protein